MLDQRIPAHQPAPQLSPSGAFDRPFWFQILAECFVHTQKTAG
jgi:hypothetical protein